jgi:hypothetical protein
MKLHTIEFWLYFFGIELIDADGWRHHELTELIDVVTFCERISQSTINITDNTKYQLFTDIN